MSGIYHLSTKADEDLVSIWSYLELYASAHSADKILSMLNTSFQTLADNPGLGRFREELQPGLRSFPANPYVIFYDVLAPGRIAIRRVIHHRQDIPSFF